MIVLFVHIREHAMEYKELYKTIFKLLDVEKILNSYNIRYSSYFGNKGREYMFRCPFPDHDDMSPSFSLNRSTGVWNCFVCGGGDFFKFIKIVEGFKTLKESIEFLKKKVGFVDNFQVSFETLDKSFEEFKNKCDCSEEENVIPELKDVSLPNCVSAEEFFDIVKKRVSIENIRKWDMKYCIEPASKYEEKYRNRLIIPVYFEGKLVTFAARDMSGRAEKWNEMKKELKKGNYSKDEIDDLIKEHECKKFLYPFGAPLSYVFFNWDDAIKKKDYVILVEGIFDAVRLIEYGFNAISILSCHLNSYRINLLIKNFNKIYVSLDNDDRINSKGIRENPGQEAALGLVKSLSDTNVYNVVLPAGKDPDECSRDEYEQYLQESEKKHLKVFTWT